MCARTELTDAVVNRSAGFNYGRVLPHWRNYSVIYDHGLTSSFRLAGTREVVRTATTGGSAAGTKGAAAATATGTGEGAAPGPHLRSVEGGMIGEANLPGKGD